MRKEKLNISAIHVDFMVGTADLSIVEAGLGSEAPLIGAAEYLMDSIGMGRK